MTRIPRRAFAAGAVTLAAVGPARAQTQHIADILAGDPRFSSFVALLSRGGLMDELRSAGPFTVFAPVNAAFDRMPVSLRESLAPANQTPDMVRLPALLNSHIVPGRWSAGMTTAANRNGGTIHVERDAAGRLLVQVGGGGFGAGGANANRPAVIETELLASNGLVVPIDTVLIP